MIEKISADAFLSQIEQLKTQQSGLADETAAGQASSPAGGADFEKMLGNLIGEVDQAQKSADLSLDKLASGDSSSSIQDVVMKMEQAEVSFKLMLEIRNKLLSAYKEVMSAQS